MDRLACRQGALDQHPPPPPGPTTFAPGKPGASGPRLGAGRSNVRHAAVDLSDFAIAAGPPTAVQPIEEALAQSGLQLQDEDLFTHRVQGDSMHDAGIREGDTLVVRRQSNAREGEIVVATIQTRRPANPGRRSNGSLAADAYASCRRTPPTSQARATASRSLAR